MFSCRLDPGTSGERGGYADAPAVSAWAQTPVKWANGEKLITGRTADTLAPGGSATRAEVATILQRFAQGVAK
jgi:hypothetical protein